jgi:FlaA1/EpsC-like NDP-sugar epimerase
MTQNHIERISHYIFNRRPWFVHLFEAALVASSLTFAWLLRFDFTAPFRDQLVQSAALLVVIRLLSFRAFNLHRGWWRYAGFRDGMDILLSVAAGSAAFWTVLHVIPHFKGYPRSIYLMEAMLTAGALVGVRLLSRVLAESLRREVSGVSKRVILIGAGFAAQMVIRELSRNGSGMEPVACVDDDPTKKGIRIHGVPVLGDVEYLPRAIQNCNADEILIAVPSATAKQMRRFTDVCMSTGMRFRTVPAIRDMIESDVSLQQFRDVDLDDLLGRETVAIDVEFVRNQLSGRVILVTGAAGSIGSELCRQIAAFSPAKIICVDQSETGIFYLEQRELHDKVGFEKVFCVADIRDRERMRRIFRDHRPQIVFHAAAYKHVPVMESNVVEAVNNNVFALVALLDTADEFHAESFVLISSDKAVSPSSVMGATKRIGELIVASRPAAFLNCVSVRFGNVLGSSGSVIPIFQEQLRNNQPLTITHPEIKRFFMTKREAISLVLEAFSVGNHGDILVLDMGEPVRILNLAKTLIHLVGKSEDDVEICITGLRDGEKLQEELFYAAEDVVFTERQKVLRARGLEIGWRDLQRHLHELGECSASHSSERTREKLFEIVSDFATESGTPMLHASAAAASGGRSSSRR